MCFSLYWLIQWLIWIVIVVGVIAIVRIVVPWAMELMGIVVDARVFRVINIIIGIILLIALLWFIYDLLSCVGLARPYPRG